MWDRRVNVCDLLLGLKQKPTVNIQTEVCTLGKV